ncbi:IS110 family transposase, partial [Streptomyces sp. NPDC048384]|uniref:IS110 family transposase n=1 Tax=Streptomyces sp. NPDC048384 TaxID=3155487 RepID=UPI0034329453
MAVPELWAGTDAGKGEHHCTVIDADATVVLSRRVPNNEVELLQLLGDVLDRADGAPVSWAIDLNAGGAALWIALLVSHGQRLFYIPGRTVHHASGAYRGDGKTDAKDAYVIADQARMRRDLQPLRETDEVAVDLKILTARRMDLSADRTRAINRLRAQLLEFFPALERAFDYSVSKSALILLTGYQTPAALRRIGRSRLTTWLKNHGVRTITTAKNTADTAVTAAEAQHTAITGEKTAAKMAHTLAREVMALDEEIAQLNALIEGRFRKHPDADVITSMPGIGDMLGAEFIAATGGDMAAFGSPDRLAGVAGLAPVPRDSGKISGNLRRPR